MPDSVDHQCDISTKPLVICHQNIASLDKKTQLLEVLLRDELNCDVLGLTEHWLSASNLNCINLDGYTLVSSYCRKTLAHGGSCIFVKNTVKAIECLEFTDMSTERYCEVSAVELIEFNVLILCIYRTNLISSVDFLSHLERLLELANESGKSFLFIGDFNIDWLGDLCSVKKQLIDILAGQSVHNEVDFPTRVVGPSSSCLDHVYSNLPRGSVVTSPLDTQLSDHRAVRAEVACARVRPPPRTRRARDFSHATRMAFREAMFSIDWDAYVQNTYSAESLATTLNNIIINKFNICFPYKLKNIRTHSWVTSELIDLKNLVFDTIKLKGKYQDPEIDLFIAKITSQYENSVKLQKRGHYENMICHSSNSCKAIWRIVNKERGTVSRSSASFTEVAKNSAGLNFQSRKAAADAMNARFVGAAAACGAPRAQLARVEAALTAARPAADRSLRLTRFTAEEVFHIVMLKIPRKPTRDIYNISMELLASAAEPLAWCLAGLFNRCIETGSYPKTLKVSKISPLFKGKGKRDDIDGYRPVSIIPAVAKILENGLSTRLTEYLAATGALSHRQYAYRAGCSTTSLTREVLRQVLEACEARRQVAVLCCDLSKAFDVADHSVLAAKLKHYGIQGQAHSLLTDLLRDRTQIVVADGGETKSDPLGTVMGVAQGSSVSNILFSLLLNDLPEHVTEGEAYMYADDVAIVVSAPSVDRLEQRLNSVAHQVAEWFKWNGLALNFKKTHFMHFCISGRQVRGLSVMVEANPIEQVAATVFLGFQIDRGLTWNKHIDNLCARLGSACFALRRLSRVVSADVVRACYFATVHSLLQYGAELWGRAADRERVFRMQKRAVRAIARTAWDAPARPYFISLQVLTLPSIIILQAVMHVRQNLERFKTRGDHHARCYNTRGAGKLASVPNRLAKSDRLTHVLGPALYNNLPDDIVTAPSLSSFKRRLKSWLVEKAFYNVEEFMPKIN